MINNIETSNSLEGTMICELLRGRASRPFASLLVLLKNGLNLKQCEKCDIGWGLGKYSFIKFITNTIKDTVTLSDHEKEQMIGLLKMALKQGVKTDVIFSQSISEASITVLEELYKLHVIGKHSDLVDRIIVALLESGTPIPAKLAALMKLELSAKNRIFENALIAQRYLIQAEAEALIKSTQEVTADPTSLLGHSQRIRTELERALRIYNSCPQDMPLDIIKRAKEIKARIKSCLQRVNKSESQNKILDHLRAEYALLVERYDRAIEKNPFLKELQQISREIRGLEQGTIKFPSLRLKRFYSLFGPDRSYGARETIENVQKLWNKSTRAGYWKVIRERALNASETVRASDHLKRRQVVWLHGSRSSALPMIARTQALIATGELLKRNLAPLSGELSGSEGDRGINVERLSGERFTSRWEEEPPNMTAESREYYFNANTRYLVSWLYATKTTTGYSTGSTDTYGFNPQFSISKTSLPALKNYLNSGNANDFRQARIHILRLRLTDPDAAIKLAPQAKFLLEEIEKLKKHNPNSELLSQLEACHHAITVKMPDEYLLTKPDLDIINERDTKPIVFAGTSMTVNIANYINREFLAKGPLALGTEIDTAFVSAEHREWFQKYLEKFGVHIYDFDTAAYLEMMSMVRGSTFARIKEGATKASAADGVVAASAGSPTAAGISTDVRGIVSVHQNLLLDPKFFARTLNQDVLPGYAIPFSQRPVFRHQGKYLVLDTPFYGMGITTYQQYVEGIASERALPRNIHGLMHASRVALWSKVLSALFNVPPEKRYWVGVAAAMHDFQRGDEGPDRWDDESALRLKAYLETTREMSEKEAAEYVHAVQHKDPQDHGADFTSDVQRIVHDADAIEIIRVLDSPNKFKKEVLQFLKLTALTDTQKEEVLQECFRFISKTESLALKLALEHFSQDYFGDVVRILGVLHARDKSFPHLVKFLAEDLKAFDPSTLREEFAKLL